MMPVLRADPDDTPGAALEAAIRGVCHSTPHRRRCLSEDPLAPNSAPSPMAPQLRTGAASQAQACRSRATHHDNEVCLPDAALNWLIVMSLSAAACVATQHLFWEGVDAAACIKFPGKRLHPSARLHPSS